MSVCSLVWLTPSSLLSESLPLDRKQGDWQPVEIVTFNDFDDLELKLDGKTDKAFLVGLRPIRESAAGKGAQERARDAVWARRIVCSRDPGCAQKYPPPR